MVSHTWGRPSQSDVLLTLIPMFKLLQFVYHGEKNRSSKQSFLIHMEMVPEADIYRLSIRRRLKKGIIILYVQRDGDLGYRCLVRPFFSRTVTKLQD